MTEHTSERESHEGASRRTLMAAAAWSVPVIAVASATPAHATSANSTLTVDVVQTSVTAGSGSQVIATVLDSQGRPWAGQPVSFTVDVGGVTFVSGSGVTDASGQFTTTLNTAASAYPGLRTVIATSDGYAATDTFTVLGTNVVASGYNAMGQLGDGTTVSRTTAVYTARVFPSPVVQVSNLPQATAYLLEDGTVWHSGSFNGSATTTPTQVAGLTGVTQISSGNGTILALLANGQLRGWGSNAYGQIGDGTTTDRATPVVVRVSAGGAALTGVTQVVSGSGFTMALLNTGQVMAWGRNVNGQLGNGTTTDSSVPVTVRAVGGAAGSALTGVASIAVGQINGFAVLTNGQGRSWGAFRALGNGTSDNSTSPVAIRNGANTANLSGIARLVGTWATAAAVLTNGQVQAWGAEIHQELGNGGTDTSPATTTTLPIPVQAVGGGGQLTSVTAMSGGYAVYHALRSDGTVVGWGNNNGGQLSTGTTALKVTTPATYVLPAGRTAQAVSGNLGEVIGPATTSQWGSVILAP